MSALLTRRRNAAIAAATVAAILGVTLASCVGADRSTGPAPKDSPATAIVLPDRSSPAAAATRGIINGWLNGKTVPLLYTRMYFCAEPPSSAVSTHCEVGAAATVTPRRGRIPKIYALAPVGFKPDPTTVHCPGGTVCLNHPHALDLSRLGLPDSVNAPAHSHVISARESGWHNTVNIRVTSLDAWNAIAQAKTLRKVRQLQARGLVGPDLPTNVYFYFEVEGSRRRY